MNNNYYGNSSEVGTNSKKLLYVVVFIAALVIAILSGTFAYFQASASANDISGRIADVDIELEVLKLNTDSSIPLIPFDASSNSSITSALSDNCIYDVYYKCDIFRINVKAKTASSDTLSVIGDLTIEPDTTRDSSSSIPNVEWVLLGPKTTTAVTSISTVPYDTSYFSYINSFDDYSVSTQNKGYLTGVTTVNDYETINLSGNNYYYVMVWLQETGTLQDDVGYYKGTVTFMGAGGNEGKISASFSG